MFQLLSSGKDCMFSFRSVAFLTKSTCELLMNVSSSNFGLSIFQIDIDRDQSLRQNPAAYTQSLDLAVRGLYRYSFCIVSCSSLMFLFLQVMLHQYWVMLSNRLDFHGLLTCQNLTTSLFLLFAQGSTSLACFYFLAIQLFVKKLEV